MYVIKYDTATVKIIKLTNYNSMRKPTRKPTVIDNCCVIPIAIYVT